MQDAASTRTIFLVPYDPRWADRFQEERRRLLDACGGSVAEVHHIGSTAIPGMAAKPIIDILATLRRHEDGLACIEPLGRLGYAYRGANGIEGRHYLTKGTPRTFHLHMYAEEHPAVARHLRFRDYLRAHPEEAAAYQNLKQRLAQRFAADPLAYANAKGEFCARIDRLASGEASRRREP